MDCLTIGPPPVELFKYTRKQLVFFYYYFFYIAFGYDWVYGVWWLDVKPFSRVRHSLSTQNPTVMKAGGQLAQSRAWGDLSCQSTEHLLKTKHWCIVGPDNRDRIRAALSASALANLMNFQIDLTNLLWGVTEIAFRVRKFHRDMSEWSSWCDHRFFPVLSLKNESRTDLFGVLKEYLYSPSREKNDLSPMWFAVVYCAHLSS